MKAVILAGGRGSRLSEETALRPKPMVEVGGKPILWHIMKLYAAHGIEDFVICLGYKGYMIKEYFANYHLHGSDVTFDLASGAIEIHRSASEPWRVTLVDTGERTMTGGRLRRVLPFLEGEDFCFTYGDGLADVDLSELVAFHRAQRRLATVTAVQPRGRYGALDMDGEVVRAFREKPRGEDGWINGGFFVLSAGVGSYLSGDETVWEREPMEALASDGQLAAFRHEGFWQAVDTQRDLIELQSLWADGAAPWRLDARGGSAAVSASGPASGSAMESASGPASASAGSATALNESNGALA